MNIEEKLKAETVPKLSQKSGEAVSQTGDGPAGSMR
jgi:hypothetical protein